MKAMRRKKALKGYIPFWALELWCRAFGHRWQETPEVQSMDPYKQIWRDSKWCQRCGKTK